MENGKMTAMDFFAEQTIGPKEYFVYFKGTLCGTARKDKSPTLSFQQFCGGSKLKNGSMTAKDFFAGQAMGPKEYFVYFKGTLCSAAKKDKSSAFIF